MNNKTWSLMYSYVASASIVILITWSISSGQVTPSIPIGIGSLLFISLPTWRVLFSYTLEHFPIRSQLPNQRASGSQSISPDPNEASHKCQPIITSGPKRPPKSRMPRARRSDSGRAGESALPGTRARDRAAQRGGGGGGGRRARERQDAQNHRAHGHLRYAQSSRASPHVYVSVRK